MSLFKRKNQPPIPDNLTMINELPEYYFIILMAIRCGFIVGSFEVTEKGAAGFSEKKWSEYFDWLCKYDNRYRELMFWFLRNVEGNLIINQALNK